MQFKLIISLLLASAAVGAPVKQERGLGDLGLDKLGGLGHIFGSGGGITGSGNEDNGNGNGNPTAGNGSGSGNSAGNPSASADGSGDGAGSGNEATGAEGNGNGNGNGNEATGVDGDGNGSGNSVLSNIGTVTLGESNEETAQEVVEALKGLLMVCTPDSAGGMRCRWE